MNIFDQEQKDFQNRHIGPHEQDTHQMLRAMGEKSLDSLIDKTVPTGIRMLAGSASRKALVNLNT